MGDHAGGGSVADGGVQGGCAPHAGGAPAADFPAANMEALAAARRPSHAAVRGFVIDNATVHPLDGVALLGQTVVVHQSAVVGVMWLRTDVAGTEWMRLAFREEVLCMRTYRSQDSQSNS